MKRTRINYTLEDFISESKKHHGDKYDYSKVSFKFPSHKVIIGCPIHGEFNQSALRHMRGGVCHQCAKMSPVTTEVFIEKARLIHGTEYDYSKVNYVNNRTKVIIGCPKHGDFEQTPTQHTDEKRGCPYCAGIGKGTRGFIEKAKLLHNDFYSYEKTKYVRAHAKVIITCPIHGDFEQTPTNHLTGFGCESCGRTKVAEILASNTEEFVQKAREKYGDTFDYTKVNYVRATEEVEIICPEHGSFFIIPNNFLRRGTCPSCTYADSSDTENILLEEIQSWGLPFRTNDRQILKPRELDFVFDDQKIAIELNGLYFHSSIFKGKSYHKDKTDGCAAQGYQLIHIYEDLWNDKRDVVLSEIKRILRISDYKVDIKDCTIKQVESSVAKAFVDNNGLEEFLKGKVYIGLYYRTELLCIMILDTMDGSNINILGLVRKVGMYAEGDISHLVSWITQNSIVQQLRVKVNRDWSNGKEFENIGFSLVHKEEPDYTYHKGYIKRFPKTVYTDLLREMNLNPDDIEEEKFMQEQKYHKIYDSGYLVYELIV